MENCKELNNCVACDSPDLKLIFDLGEQSPVNNYDIKEKYPLRLNQCIGCSHLQLSHSVDPEILFPDNPYRSDGSVTMHHYFNWFASKAIEYNPSAKNALDIGCNDGSQLDYFKEAGLGTFGVDPMELRSDKWHQINKCFFPSMEFNNSFSHPDAGRIDMKFDIITAQNVFALTANSYEFLIGCKELMNDNSVLFIQSSQAAMIEHSEYDTICHEHISFFNLNSMAVLIKRAGLELADYFRVPVHGGSHVFVIKKPVEAELFCDKAKKHAQEIKKIIKNHRKDGFVIIGYGASAKLINLINYSGVKMDYIIDDTENKQGQQVSIFNIPVIPSKGFNFNMKTFNVLWVPTWNFFDEIQHKIKQSCESGREDKFLRVFPKIELI